MTQSATQTQSTRGQSFWRSLVRSQEFGVFIILVLMMALLSVYTRIQTGEDRFLTSTNIFNNLRSFSWIAISAFGQCMVIITTGIDLSVGSVMAWAGLVSAMLLVNGTPMPVAVARRIGRRLAGRCSQRPDDQQGQAAALHRHAGHPADDTRRRSPV